jgi:hypothetical protein
MEATVEVVVVALGVEVDDCRLVELTQLGLLHHHFLHWHYLIKELLQVLFAYLEMEISQQAFVYVVRFHHFLHCAACSQNEVS